MTEQATLTLAGFLLARIDEDEATIAAPPHPEGLVDPELPHPSLYWADCDEHGPWLNMLVARASAECEAKRLIVGELVDFGGPFDDVVLQFLALPYAEHPDYREEWRP